MRNFLMANVLVFIGSISEAQVNDTIRIVGTWRLDSVAMEDMGLEDLEIMEGMKSLVFMTFNSDSTVILPDFESDFDGDGNILTVTSGYYLKGQKLYLDIDDDVIDYEFINDYYLELKDDGESMFFKKE